MITVVVGSQENFDADIRLLLPHRPDRTVLIAKGKEAVDETKRLASSLFLDPSLLLVLFFQEPGPLREISREMARLKDAIDIIIYVTFSPPRPLFDFHVQSLVIEKDKEKRIEQRVRLLLKSYGKKMTKGAFELLRSVVEDETLLDQEVLKCINFVGEKELIERSDVDAVLCRQSQVALSHLLEAMAKKDRRRLLLVLDTLFASGHEVQSIQSYLLRHIRLLLHAKDAALLERPKSYGDFVKGLPRWKEQLRTKPVNPSHYLPYQRPFYAYKLLGISEEFSDKSLRSLFESLSWLESAVRRGAKNERLLLEYMLLDA